MRKFRHLLWHRLSRRQLAALFVLATADCLVVLTIVGCALAGATEVALPLLPTFSSLFLILVATLACFAHRQRVSWCLVCATAASGPFGATALLRVSTGTRHGS